MDTYTISFLPYNYPIARFKAASHLDAATQFAVLHCPAGVFCAPNAQKPRDPKTGDQYFLAKLRRPGGGVDDLMLYYVRRV